MQLRNPLLALVLACALVPAAHAHKAFMVPSQTVLSGSADNADSWVTVDAAVSNDLFYFNHRPMALDALTITAPDGTTIAPENVSKGEVRSVFDVHLTQQGTYKLAIASSGLMARYKLDGENKRWMGTAKDWVRPKGATDLVITQSSRRLETFVTLGAPSLQALKPTGKGLEMVPVTHFNDLYAGEAATFQLLLDGKPARDFAVTVIPGDSLYRNTPDEIHVTTDKKGNFSVTWPHAGRYWLNASVKDNKSVAKPATERNANYTAVLEVLPL